MCTDLTVTPLHYFLLSSNAATLHFTTGKRENKRKKDIIRNLVQFGDYYTAFSDHNTTCGPGATNLLPRSHNDLVLCRLGLRLQKDKVNNPGIDIGLSPFETPKTSYPRGAANLGSRFPTHIGLADRAYGLITNDNTNQIN